MMAAMADEAQMASGGWRATGCVAFGSSRPCPAAVLEISPPGGGGGGGRGEGRPGGGGGGGRGEGTPSRRELLTGRHLRDTSAAAQGAWQEEAHAAAMRALEAANGAVPSYAAVPPPLLYLFVAGASRCPSGDSAPLARTAKGGIVRRGVEARFGRWLDAAFADAAAARGGKGRGEGDGGGEGGAMDSLGLAALAGGGGGVAGEGYDAVLLHVKVALLLPVLLRHLQRFTIRTCHAWERTSAVAVPTCAFNNVAQTGAAEGLAFLSGAAVAGARLDAWQAGCTSCTAAHAAGCTSCTRWMRTAPLRGGPVLPPHRWSRLCCC